MPLQYPAQKGHKGTCDDIFLQSIQLIYTSYLFINTKENHICNHVPKHILYRLCVLFAITNLVFGAHAKKQKMRPQGREGLISPGRSLHSKPILFCCVSNTQCEIANKTENKEEKIREKGRYERGRKGEERRNENTKYYREPNTKDSKYGI